MSNILAYAIVGFGINLVLHLVHGTPIDVPTTGICMGIFALFIGLVSLGRAT